jgi:ribosomal protein S18 acetylase RimI-like enzyme
MEQRLVLPLTLIDQDISLRPQTDADAGFIKELYASVRWQELAGTGWPEELKHAFLTQQLTLQTHHYVSHYGGLCRGIILWQNKPIGRIYLWENDKDLRIVDLSLLPNQRCLGIGTQLLQTVICAARQTGSSVSLYVDPTNPARLLYQRVGFRCEGEGNAHHLFMRHQPLQPS